MIFRAIIVLLGCALTAAHAASGTYQRTQPFNTKPDNWRFFNPNQGYGFFPTGPDAGLAGGFFFPKGYTSYYGDTSLNGLFQRGTPVTASGRMRLDEVSFDPNYTNSVYVGYFRAGSTKNTFVNILGMSLTGSNQGVLKVAPVVEFASGNAFLGSTITLPVSARPVDWSFTWDPTPPGVALGVLTLTITSSVAQADGSVTTTTSTSTLSLGSNSAGLDFSLDSFGLYQPAFVQPNSNTFFVFFINRLNYTAFIGGPPKVHVKGPQKIQTSSSAIVLNGTSHTTIGNTIVAVRYRVIHGGNQKSYKNASGTTQWSARIHIPQGSSKIQVTAFSDNGLTKTVTRNVTRTP